MTLRSETQPTLNSSPRVGRIYRLPVYALLLPLLLANRSLSSAAGAESNAGKERALIKVLQSDAAPEEKAITCKKLAIYGTRNAVPALAPLLPDDALSSWARTALEAIPGPASDKALRDAAATLHGRMLVGVINSIGVRRDRDAVGILASKLKDPEADTVSAAAVALGRIGGKRAGTELEAALHNSMPAASAAIAEGCIRCAQQYLAGVKRTEAAALYDLVRAAPVPKQKVLEATRGAILARGSQGIPLLLEQIRSSDRSLFGLGLRTARELPGPKATSAVIAELSTSTPDRQPLLLLALAERDDPAALPTIVASARNGSKKLRLTAIGVLDRSGQLSTLPVLLELATDQDSAVSLAAKNSVVRMPGDDVDSALLARLSTADTKTRPALIELAGRRGIQAALPEIEKQTGSLDRATQSAALLALGLMGGDKETAELVTLLQQSPAPEQRAEVEKALLAISSRSGEKCVPHILALTRNGDSSIRLVGLHALAAAGGKEALAALQTAAKDSDTTVQDEAVRTLSSWPNTWPEDSAVEEPLLELAKSSQNQTHQVLALRGYLQFLQGDKKLRNGDKTTKIKEVLPLLQRPEEKRLAISVLSAAPGATGLMLLAELAGEPSVSEDACSALVSVASKDKPRLPKEDRQKALLTVLDKSGDAETKKNAEAALEKLK
ncbi:MAG TPA: HEAT repeat domain-containing protein [Candidatus Binatia bacterium]|jgi:HEAT repeat protein|nr:HEAT repeat domain-containing protein [Candidatus Binatia bacterium]